MVKTKMSIWYEVEKTEKGIRDFLESNWFFHDFRPERVTYVPGKDMTEIFLRYDTMDEGVLLRFAQIHGMSVNIHWDYDAEWLLGSDAILLDDHSIIWMDDDGWGDESKDHLEEIKQSTTWVEAERIFWAITDGDGNPVEMPSDRLDQVWDVYGEKTEKHFDLKPFVGNFNDILRPYYDR